VAVVEQLPRGGGDATVGRTRYHARIHMAILRICDTGALDAMDRGALTGRYSLLFMDSRAFYLYDMRYVCMVRAMLWLMYA
jgi:hypothetical protein